jgi:hypothetical protein
VQIAQTGEVPPLGSFLTTQERTAIQMSESIAAGNTEIDRRSRLIRSA